MIIIINRIRVLFFALAAFISCTLFSFCSTQDDNAAPYYIKAYELMTYPDYNTGKSTQETIDDIIKNGYRPKNTKIEEILKNNEPALKELEKGARKPKCNFTPFAKSLRGSIPNYMAIRSLVKLSTVKGRYYANMGKYDKASGSYLDVVALAKHLPQEDKLLIAKMIDVALVAIVTPSIKTLVQEKAVLKETLTKIDKQLHDYELHTVTLVEVFQTEKKLIPEHIKDWLNDTRKQNAQQTGRQMTDSERKHLYDQTIIEAEPLINTYMGHYIKAAQTNNPTDWDFAVKEAAKLSESSKSTMLSFGYKETVKLQAKIMVSSLIPNLKRAGEQYYSAMNGIKEARELIAKRVR